MNEIRPEWLQQTEGILEALNEGVLIVDDCNRILSINDCLAQMCGRERSAVLGRTPAEFYLGDDLALLNQQIARGEREGRNRFEFYVPQPDGARVPVVVSSRIVEDPEGRRFAVVTFTDISEQKQAEEQLKAANQQLEQRQREIETELALAARVQQSLAPQGLRWGCVAVEVHYLPARTIGGDFGLVAPAGDGQLNLVLCDVSGHGISAALVANRIYSELMSLLERQTELGETLRQLNRFVLQQIQVSCFFFSLAAAQLADGGRRVRFTAAGHPPAMWLSPSGECRLLVPKSSVLGCLEEAVSAEPVEEIHLQRGDRLMLYTDGLTDVFDHRGEMLGVEGLKEIARRAAAKPVAEMKRHILEGVSAWRHGPVSDDVSLVLVEVC